MELKATITLKGSLESDLVNVTVSFDPPLPGEKNLEPNPHQANPTVANLAWTGFRAIREALEGVTEEDGEE